MQISMFSIYLFIFLNYYYQITGVVLAGLLSISIAFFDLVSISCTFSFICLLRTYFSLLFFTFDN